MLGQLNNPPGILNYLHGFNTGQVVEEPSATGVHQHGVALQLQQLPHRNLFLCRQLTAEESLGKFLPHLGAPVEHHLNVAVARLPRITQILCAQRFKKRIDSVAQPIQRLPQRAPPLLVPTRSSAIAAAVAPPALHPVHATPGGILMDLHFMRGRTFLQKFAIVGDLGLLARFNQLQRIGKRHLAVLMMVPIGFAVGGDMR